MAEPILVAVALSGEQFREKLEQIWGRGDALMPVDPALAPQARRRLIAQIRPHVIVDESGEVRLDSGAAIAAGTALVVPTSGTSGRPKGVVLSRRAVEHSAASGMRRIGYRPQERWLVCLPLHHIAGVMMLVRSMLCGSSAVIHPRFEAEAIRAEKRTTLIALVPTALMSLLDAGVDLSGYTAVRVGGAGPSQALLERAREANVPVVNGYGMTETCGGCVYDGQPLDGVEVRLGNGGEILVRGPVLMDGYRLAAEPTSSALRDGWLLTGDRGSIDAHGHLSVTGRLDDTIISGGENIDAVQVEEILASHPAVSDCAVVGLPDEKWGQVAAAAIVWSGPEASLDEVRGFVGSQASRRIAPKRLMGVPAIPRTATGKIRRREVAAWFEDRP